MLWNITHMALVKDEPLKLYVYYNNKLIPTEISCKNQEDIVSLVNAIFQNNPELFNKIKESK